MSRLSIIVEAAQAREGRLLPIGLSAGARVVRPVAEDQMLSYDDVDLPEGGFAYHLRRVQDHAANP